MAELTLRSTGKRHKVDFDSRNDKSWAGTHMVVMSCGYCQFDVRTVGMWENWREPKPTDVKCRRCFKAKL